MKKTLWYLAFTVVITTSQFGSVKIKPVIANDAEITSVIIEGNTVFTDEQLEVAIADFIGEPITLENIQQIAKAITSFYFTQGYTTSEAYPLSQQNLTDGKVQIFVLEGYLEAIEIEGLSSVKASYLQDRLISVGEVINTNQLVEQLQILQLNPLLASVKAELKQGNEPQSTILSLNVKENPNFNLSLGIDNYGAYNSGKIQGNTSFTINSLTGNGDRFFTEFVVSEGSKQFVADYQYPLNALNGVLRFHYEGGTSKIITEPLERFDIEGDYQKAFVQWRQPVKKTLTDELAFVVEAGWQESQSFLDNQPFSFFADIPDSGYQSYTLRLAGEYFKSLPDQALALRGEVTFGIDSLETTSDPYVILRGQAQYLKKFSDNWLLFLTLSGQITSSSLGGAEFGILPSEQFPLGGIATVPGYDLNFRRGDNGINARMELVYTFVDRPDWGEMELVPFLSIGKVWSERGVILEPQSLASLGLSWHWNWQGWQTRVGYAIPLIEENVSQEFKQDFYFSIQKKFSF